MKKVELNKTYVDSNGRGITPFEYLEAQRAYMCRIVVFVGYDENGEDITKEYEDFLTACDILH